MEPFSIATGVVGILAAIDSAQKCVRKVRTMRNAHSEIVKLAEDVSDLHTTLTQVSALVDEDGQVKGHAKEGCGGKSPVSTDALRTLEQLGKKAAAKLDKLAHLIPEPTASDTSKGQGRLGKLGITEQNWQWTRNRRQAQQLQEELRAIQLNILMTLSVICSSLSLDGKSWRSENLAIVIKQENQVVFKSSPEHSTESDCDLRFEQGPNYTETEKYNLLDSEKSVKSKWASDTGLVEDTSTVETSNDMTRKLPQEMVSKNTSTQHAIRNPGALIRRAASAPNSCQDWCSCRCHKRTLLRTSNPDAGLFGSLFVSSNGTFFGVSACDQQKCRQNVRKVFKLMYQPPKWLSNYRIQFSFCSDPLYGPELSVRLPRMVDWHSPLWKHGITGNTKAIKQMFESGEASPYDVNPLGGSLLHYATERCYFDLCGLLIELGAATFIVDDLGGNPTWIAFELLLSGKLKEDEAAFVWKHFDAEGYVESREFSVLHKITLGLARLDLAAMLDISTADINVVDAEGKTCLAWTALRSDSASMKILLEYGADPNIADFRKRTPLLHVQSFECCELLLQHGADIQARDEGGRTALHWACRENQGNPEVVRSLLAGRLDPNTRDNSGETALINAVFNGNEECVVVLLDGDLDVTNNGVDLIKCLADSIGNEHYEVLRYLRNHCSGFEKFAYVLPEDGKKPWTASDIDTMLVEYFETEKIYLTHAGKHGKDTDENLRSQTDDFGKAFGWAPSFWDLDTSQMLSEDVLSTDKKDIFVDAVECLPDLEDLSLSVTA